jgi:single-strand DNA-binding protein
MGINTFVCTGRLTKDPQFRQISDETAVCDLRVAVDGMGRSREVGFIDVRVFGNAGRAAAEHLTKGWLVAVEGRLEFSEWETDTGSKRHSYAVIGGVEFLAAPRRSGEPAHPPDAPELTSGERILLA